MTPHIHAEDAIRSLRAKWGTGGHLTLDAFESPDEPAARNDDPPILAY